MATVRRPGWDRRVVGPVLVGLVLLVALAGDPRGWRVPGRDASADPPTQTTPDRLCGALVEMAQLRDDLVAGSTSTTVADLREAAVHTRDLGPRTRGLDPQARAGLDYVTGFFVALPDRPTLEQLTSSGGPASIGDQAHADAFVSWLQVNCPQGAQGAQ